MASTHRNRVAGIVFISFCAIWYFNVNGLQQGPHLGDTPSDFLHHYRAAQRILSGNSPYIDADYDYPPLIAFLVTPLGFGNYPTARWIWFLLSQVCLLTAAWLMWRALGRDQVAACCVACVWAFGGAAGENLALGQLGPLLVLMIALAHTRVSVSQGVALGVGLGLKFIPGLLGVALLLRRDWRALMALFGTALLVVLIPWAIVWHHMSGPAAPIHTDYWMGTPATLSWSVSSVLLRALDPPRRGGELPYNWDQGNIPTKLHLTYEQRLMSVGAAGCTLALGIIALAVGCRGKLSGEQLSWAMAALVSLGVAASPISWTHYQILQYPGLALIQCEAMRLRKWLFGGWIFLCGAFLYQIPVAILTAYYRRHGGWMAASPETLYIWTTVTPLVSLALFCSFLSQIVSSLGVIGFKRRQRVSSNPF